jgi:aspartate/methionine/tyrosine aminotransferase
MRHILSHLAETLPGSQILAISGKIKKKMEQGEAIINLTVGDFNPIIFPIPEKLKREIVKAYEQNLTNYPAAEGDIDLRKSLSGFISETQKIEYSTDEILVGAGGRPLIYTLFRAIVDEDDTVVYPVPSWNNHYYTQLTKGRCIELETEAENHFMPTASQLQPHLNKAVLIGLCSPQNPTGTSFTKEGLKEICELVVKENNCRKPGQKKCYILFDQMYGLLTNAPAQHPAILCPEVREYVITIDAISKCFAATGVRVGWACGPAAVLSKMKAILSHVGAWAPMPEQKATAIFLKDQEAVNNYLTSFKAKISWRLIALYDGFLGLQKKGLPVQVIRPEGAIYLSVKIDLPDPVESMLKAGVGILPFHVFGSSKESKWCRISIGTLNENEVPRIIEACENAFNELNQAL